MRTFGRQRYRGRSDTKRGEGLSLRVLKKGSLEKDLLSEVKKVLNNLQDMGFLAFRRIHTMPVFRAGMVMTPNKDMRGLEDVQIYLIGGRTLYLELKSAQGKQSVYQKQREQELKNLGHQYYVIRDIDSFFGVLAKNGLPVY